jgi:hypothetical protein
MGSTTIQADFAEDQYPMGRFILERARALCISQMTEGVSLENHCSKSVLSTAWGFRLRSQTLMRSAYLEVSSVKVRRDVRQARE